MPQGNAEFEQIVSVLMQPWQPDGALPHPPLDGGESDGQWFQIIEQLEYRILLAYALTGREWDHSARRTRNQKSSVLSRHSLRQCQLLLNAFIVTYCSRPQAGAPEFPFIQVMESLLTAKIHLTHDPALKQILRASLAGLQSGNTVELPEITMFSEGKKRTLFKYFTMYGVVMNWIKFDAHIKEKLSPFSSKWLHDEDGVLLALISYAALSENSQYNLPVMLKKTFESLKTWPNLESIYNAISISMVQQQ